MQQGERRRSKRTAERISLPKGDMRIDDSEPESTSSDDDEESPYERGPTPPDSPAATQQKRKGKSIRTESHEHSQGTGQSDRGDDENDDEEEEIISALGPQLVHSGPPTHYSNVTLRPPRAPEHRNRVNYKAKGMTEQTRIERAKNPKEVGGSQLDYRFGTAFHQDYYEGAILKKDIVVACSQFIDWKFIKAYNDPRID